MIYYCVKTDEFLQSVLSLVSNGGSHYLQLKIAQNRAEATIQKFESRYQLSQSKDQRYRALQKQPVLDLVVLQNRTLRRHEQVLLCMIATLPSHIKNGDGEDLNASDWLIQTYGEKEQFFSVSDCKNRLFYSITLPPDDNPSQKRTGSNLSVYELVKLPYSKEERKKAKIDKLEGWTWRLSKDYQKYKLLKLEAAFKQAQQVKGKGNTVEEQDSLIRRELNILQNMAGFRGARDDVFKLQQPVLGWYRRYLNRPCPLELKIPRYVMKRSRLCRSLSKVYEFHQKLS